MTVYNVLLKIVHTVHCKSSGREGGKKKEGKQIKDSRLLTGMPSSVMNHVPIFISRDASMECLLAAHYQAVLGCMVRKKSGW